MKAIVKMKTETILTLTRKDFKTKSHNYVNALLNTDGGKLRLVTGSKSDKVIKPIEENVQRYLGSDVHKYLSTASNTSGEHVMTIKPHKTVCTMKVNAYIPTNTQVIEVSSSKVEELLNENRSGDGNEFQNKLPATFTSKQHIALQESKTVQFKQSKEPKKNVADLLKDNKLNRYVSAFANYHGGRIYCGVNDDGIVEGQDVKQEDKDNIINSIDGYIKAMVWPEVIGEPARGEQGQWDISFIPVVDHNGNHINQSKYVVVVTIVKCPGGVFVKDPESYLVVNGEVQKMKFCDWKRRIGTQNWRLKRISPCKWSSEELRNECEELDGTLLRFINEGDWVGFEKLATESNIKVLEIDLVVLCKWCAYHYRRDNFTQAEYFHKALNARLVKSDDAYIFDTKRALVLSALERSKGNHWESYQVAKEMLAKIEQIDPCLLTVESYIHLATMLTINQGDTLYAKQLEEDLPPGKTWKDEVISFYNNALQHLEEISYIPESQLDRGQKVYIHMAVFKLGCSLSGSVLIEDDVPLKDIEEAETCLKRADELNTSKHSITDFRKCHYLFAQACLLYRQAQHEESKAKQAKILKSVIQTSKRAEECAENNNFQELLVYARRQVQLFVGLRRSEHARGQSIFTGILRNVKTAIGTIKPKQNHKTGDDG